MDDVEAVVPVTANEKPEKVEDTAALSDTKTENESETNGTSHDKVEGDVEVKGEEVELAVAVDNIPNEPENDDDDDDVIIEIVPEEKADDDEDDMPALVEDVAEIKEQIIEEVVASETDTDLSALVTTSQPVVEADDSELSAAIAMINGPDEVKNTEEVVQEVSDELKKTEECVAENGETETVVQEDTVADDIYADLDTDEVVNEDVHSQNVIDNLASEQMEVDGGTGDPIKSPEENYVTSPLSRDEYSDEPMDDDYYDESEDQYDDDEDDDVHPAVQEKPKTNQKPVNDPIEIVSLDDSDEDDEDQKIQSDDRSEGDDDYEETDDESVDDDDDVVHSKRHPIRVDAKPGSSKMVFNPLAALMRVPDKKQRPVQRHYTKGQLSRMYLKRMGRRSRRWLSWRQNKIQQKSKSSSTMQIMDDSDVVECETKIPNHASPKIVKADDLSKEIKKVIAVDKEEPQPKNEENKENDKDLNENKLEEVVEDEEKLSDTVQILDESDEPVEEVVADDDEEHVVSVQSQNDEVKVDDIGSDHESDKKPQVNGEVTVENAQSPVVEKISESTEKKDETSAINEEQARIIEELKELSAPKQEKAPERPQKRPLEQTEDDEVDENPVKRLRSELENNFGQHNKILREYIEHTSSKSSAKDLEQHIAMIDSEIYTLDKMLLAKEEEWNNIIHLKKVKEEIRLRLTRKRDVLDMNVTSAFTDDHEKVTSTPISTNTSQTVMFNASSLLQNTLRSFRDAKKKESNINNNANNAMAAANAAAAAAFAQNLNQNVTMIPLSNSSTTTSSCSSTAAHAILQNRVNTKPTDKEKSVAQKVHRNILPRPTMLPNHEQILRNLAMSSASTSEAQAAANAFTDLLNGHANSVNMGRQGPIKAVSSIIADFREKHPEQIPRRGRRMKGPHESTSRPSSADSSHSNPPTTTAAANNFKDILAQFAKMSPHERQLLSSSNSIISALNMSTQFQQAQIAAAVQASQQQHVKLSHLQGNKDTTTSINNTTKPPPYPEVTLHPVVSATSAAAAAAQLNQNDQNSGSNSLLHGILTKTSNRPSATNTAAATNNAFTSGYSPTLARLLTSPERISAHQQNYQQQPSAVSNPLSTIAAGLNLSNKNSEITITPVVNSQTLQQTLLAHQQQRQKDFISMDDDNDDNSQDRLVIDEGDNQQNSYSGQDLDADVPRCQGCKKHESRFVCAGCGNQWYCSRECQVAAWDEHSEVCTG